MQIRLCKVVTLQSLLRRMPVAYGRAVCMPIVRRTMCITYWL